MNASPYLVEGDIVIQNGAILSIDPGVVIYMSANAGMTVQAGGIQAEGEVAAPIRVLSGKTRHGQVAAPGDWRHWTFNVGAVNTRLENVMFEHGSGLVVRGSAPVFNNLDIRNHEGAAISVDLAASPTGAGNRASGNTLNGIAVPPGDIAGRIQWGLRGIPYVITSGVVSVGATPAISSITPNTLQQGETITATLTGSRLAGLASAEFDQSGLVAQVLAGATNTQATLSIAADAEVAPGVSTLRLLTDAGEVRLSKAITVVQSQPVLSSLAPSTLHTGQGAVDVAVVGRNLMATSTVLADGAAVATKFQSANGLTGRLTAPATPGNILVRVRTPNPVSGEADLLSNELVMPVVAAQLTVTPATTTVLRGNTKTMSLNLPYPAGAGGLVINLVSSVPAVAAVPATVIVPEGQAAASFQLTANDLGATTITASRAGFLSGQALVTVVTPPKLTLTPANPTLGVGRTVDLSVQSSAPAPAGGLTVGLTSSNAAAATIPDSVIIPAGDSSATTQISTVAVGSTIISAQAPDYVAGQSTVTVRPISLSLPSGALVAPGLSRSIPLTLSDPAPAGGLVVTLTSNNTATASVPASLTLDEGQTSANFTLTGVATGEVIVNASASGYQPASLPVTVETVTIRLGSPTVSSISVPVDNAKSYAVTLSRPAPAGGVEVSLAMDDSSTATVSPSTVTIAEGQTSGGTVLVGVTGVAKGYTALTASSPGLNAANVQVNVTAKPVLSFSTNALTVGKGLKTYYYEIWLRRTTDGSAYSPDQDLTVNLASSDASKASVPATVTIPANSSEAYFYVTGVDLTGASPVTIDATAAGYSAPATKPAVKVVAPAFTLQYLDVDRSPASARDDFTVRVTTPGANYSGNQAAAADLPIDLSIVEGTPSGIVEGFYSALTGGAPITQVILRQDYTSSDTAYVGTPTTAGSYKVQASAVGGATGTSDLVTVSAPQLQFSVNTVTVGKGLTTYYYEARVRRAVNGTAFNGAEPVTVNLASSDASKASVPATVTIPANSSEAYFYVTGVDLTSASPVTVDATASGYSAPTTKLAVNVVAPVFNIQSLDTNRSPASARDNFTVRVTTPGAAYSGSQWAAVDLPIDLSIVEGTPSGIVEGFYSALTGGAPITQVILRQGYTSSDTAYVGTPTAAGSYRVQASVVGVATGTSGLVTVSAPQLQFSVNTVTVGKGLKTYYYEARVRRTVNGAAFNGVDAVTVNLGCSSTAICTVPPNVVIPAESSEVYFDVTGIDVGSTTVTANAVGYSSLQDLAVSVVPPQLNFSGPNDVQVGAQSYFEIYLTTPGAAYSGNQTAVKTLNVDLTSSAPGVATVPTTTSIAVGRTRSDSVSLTGVGVGTTTLTASGSGLSSATSGVITIKP